MFHDVLSLDKFKYKVKEKSNKMRFILFTLLVFGIIFLAGCALPKDTLCGDGKCDAKELSNPNLCPQDYKVCQRGENGKGPTTSKCGDKICDAKELSNPNLCPQDYKVCQKGETPNQTAGEEPYCGDERCNGAETCSTCPADCGVCPPPTNETRTLTVSDPFAPFDSNGDLWLSTWADNDDVFVGWGDGIGPVTSLDPESLPSSTHHGLALLHGAFPNVTFTVVNRAMPFSDEAPLHNSKPAGLLYINGRLYVSIHRPLMWSEYGFLAYSDDNGQTFQFPAGGDTWSKPSPFLVRMFLNMGQGYRLNTDGYVYIYGIGSEIDWDYAGGGRIYLARAPKDDLLNLETWEYFAGFDGEQQPMWGTSESSSQALPGVSSHMIFSAIYHPGIEQYLILTAETASGNLYRADQPWGPWTLVGQWFPAANSEWADTYMPGIITKDLGANSFYFAAAGVHYPGAGKSDSKYRFRLGLMTVPNP